MNIGPKLYNGQKIPMWNHRAHIVHFLVFPYEHYFLIANVRNFHTGYTLPQYHVSFDDLFHIVFNLCKIYIVVVSIYNQLFEENSDQYAEQKYEDDELVHRPHPLHDVWLDEANHFCCNEQRELNHWQNFPEPDVIPLNLSYDLPVLNVPVYDDE